MKYQRLFFSERFDFPEFTRILTWTTLWGGLTRINQEYILPEENLFYNLALAGGTTLLASRIHITSTLVNLVGTVVSEIPYQINNAGKQISSLIKETLSRRRI